MSQRNRANLAKLAELKLKLQRDGFDEKIPLDKRLYPKFLRRLRLATGMTSAPFWTLFDIPTSTGAKYENQTIENQRICPPELMAKLSEHLGLRYTETDNPEPVLRKVVGLPEDLRELVAFLYAHNLTLQDLKNYVEIKALMRR